MVTPYVAYILYSVRLDVFYVGHTSDIKERMTYHNGGHETYTRKGVPWELLWIGRCADKSSAMILEIKIKKLSRRRKYALMEKYAAGLQITLDRLKEFEP